MWSRFSITFINSDQQGLSNSRMAFKKEVFRRSQISIEYLAVFAFATAMTVPLLIIFITHTTDASNAIAVSQANQIARNVVDAAETVYYLGEPSSTLVKVYMPERVDATEVTAKEVTIRMKFGGTTTDVVASSRINLTGYLDPSPGIQYIRVEARGGVVNISMID